jgi:drug/metabolite transporter (DMT)-like permease
MIHIPILGALAFATSSLFEKIILKNKKIKNSSLVVGFFLAAIIFMLPFVYFFSETNPLAWKINNLLILVAIVFFSIIANLFAFYSLKWEKLTQLEPVRLLEPLLIIIIAFIFFKSERNVNVVIPAIIAGLALIFSHIKRHHFKFNKYLIAGTFGSFFYAIEMVLSKIILPYYNPLTLYFVRSLGVFLISLVIFRPNLVTEFSKKEKVIIGLVGICWVIFRVATYYGYLFFGVISTTLILMLAPIFVYLFAHKFLKEKTEWRNIVAAIVIVGCVLYGILS